ncbi:FAD-dependent pyridine nucleotide-disulphide oxidoreductase [Ammonifex degensii KC4]|uniref:FAD-dependent pyridine nucleotide-disulphide oxidoreductase n=1 Tax=Ammonifex degensii (strain DSM 10501 / KC4) TaxID=429009 RepID=C9R8A0_AMMDK|nr:FAD-dependent oxidoreductase [Ammonifex degensii]ACX52529.1 FAD-dependent pyridine nucleotide-disulphide oxidoreductase [Ammonifex degensii KC4]
MKVNYDVVVIGGGTAGVTAATTARRHYPDKKVLLIRREEKTLIPCGIPYMFGVLDDPCKNVNPDYILSIRGIEVKVGEVKEIVRQDKKLVMTSGEEIGYDRLVLATGSRPALPAIPGIDQENVFWIKKELPYLQKVLAALAEARRVVIIGGGFVGVELAEQIRKYRQLEVTIVEILPYCLYTSFDEEFCFEAERELQALGVDILTEKKVAELAGNGKVKEVRLEDGTVLPADVVIITTGVRPVTELAEAAGLSLGPTGGILVDRTMATSDPNIFACGDCAEKFSFFGGNPVRIRLASVAAMEARVAGANLFARRRENPGTVGVFSTRIGDKAFGAAGLIERIAEEEGYDVLLGEASAPNRHPSALPGTFDTKVKLVFDRYTGILLGGQAVGSESVGELVNLLSACLLHRMTAVEMAAFQMGTHPLLTPSPPAYPLVVAAEEAAVAKLEKKREE